MITSRKVCMVPNNPTKFHQNPIDDLNQEFDVTSDNSIKVSYFKVQKNCIKNGQLTTNTLMIRIKNKKVPHTNKICNYGEMEDHTIRQKPQNSHTESKTGKKSTVKVLQIYF